MATAVLRVDNPNDFVITFDEASERAVKTGATELRVEIPAGVYDDGPRTLSLEHTTIRKLTVVGIGGPVIYRRSSSISFKAPVVMLRELVFEAGQGSSAAVTISADEHIDVDGLAVIAKRHTRSVGPPKGSIELHSRTGTATASLRRLWLVDNVSSGGAGIRIVGSHGHKFAKVEVADSVFAHNQTVFGISAEHVAQLHVDRVVVLEPLLSYAWLELVHETVQASISDSVIATAHGLLSYRQYPGSKPADFAKPILRKVTLRGGKRGELVEAPDRDLTFGPPLTRTDWDAVARAARELAMPDRASLVP